MSTRIIVIIALALYNWFSVDIAHGQGTVVLLKAEPTDIVHDVVEVYLKEYGLDSCLVSPCSLFMYVSKAGKDSLFVSIQQMNYFFTFGNSPPQLIFRQSNCQILVELRNVNQTDLFIPSNGIHESFSFPAKRKDVVAAESEATLWDFLIYDGRFQTINKFGCR